MWRYTPYPNVPALKDLLMGSLSALDARAIPAIPKNDSIRTLVDAEVGTCDGNPLHFCSGSHVLPLTGRLKFTPWIQARVISLRTRRIPAGRGARGDTLVR